MSEFTRDCIHGHLARSCTVCEQEAELEKLRAFVVAWDAYKAWMYCERDGDGSALLEAVEAAREAIR